jgi:hypothetical protein
MTSVLELLALIEPHPDLVASKSPTPLQVTESAALLGWLPEPEDRFTVAEVG